MLGFGVFIAWIATAGFTSVVAGEKGYSRFRWGIGGFLFGPMALLSSIGLPDQKPAGTSSTALKSERWANDPDILRAMGKTTGPR